MSTAGLEIRIPSLRFSWVDEGAPDAPEAEALCQSFARISGRSDSTGITARARKAPVRFFRLLKRKENSSQGLHRRLEVRLRCRALDILVPVEEY
jgi:hypothetical protein